MAFRVVNPQLEIAGFYVPKKGNVLTGIVKKRIGSKRFKDGGTYLVEATEAFECQTTDPKSKKTTPFKCNVGQIIGLSDCASLHEHLNDAANSLVRVTFIGEKESTKYPGKKMKMYQVEIDDGN
jgi:hypothetical protein